MRTACSLPYPLLKDVLCGVFLKQSPWIPDGALVVSCLPVLCGNNGEACWGKYGSYPLHRPYCHEMALRILLASIESHANRYKRHIVPVGAPISVIHPQLASPHAAGGGSFRFHGCLAGGYVQLMPQPLRGLLRIGAGCCGGVLETYVTYDLRDSMSCMRSQADANSLRPQPQLDSWLAGRLMGRTVGGRAYCCCWHHAVSFHTHPCLIPAGPLPQHRLLHPSLCARVHLRC